MGLSRMAKKCRECPIKDICDRKRREAEGVLPWPVVAEAAASASADIANSIVQPHAYREVRSGSGATITVDLVAIGKQLARERFEQLMQWGC